MSNELRSQDLNQAAPHAASWIAKEVGLPDQARTTDGARAIAIAYLVGFRDALEHPERQRDDLVHVVNDVEEDFRHRESDKHLDQLPG
jgi:hypothetical protein